MKQLIKVLVSTLAPMLIVLLGLHWLTPQPQSAGATIDLTGKCPGGVGNVAFLKSAISSANATAVTDTIVLAANCVYTLTAADNSNNGLPLITNSLVISGNGSTILRSSGSGFRFFLLIPLTATLALHDLTLRNGSTGNGAAIFADGGLTLIGVKAVSNTATAGGGAVVAGSTVLIQNSLFQSNTVGSGSGGALTAGGAQIEDSTFINNHASANGGALQLAVGGLSSAILRTQFISNTAANGGALNILLATVAITDSNFLSNTATADGGAIHALTSTLALASTIFPTITTFQHNTAASGGALLLSGPGALALNAVTFHNNQTTGEGGAVALLNGAGPVNIVDSNFIGNSASAGGALRIGSGSVVSQAVFGEYFTNTATTGAGGAILNDGTLLFGGNAQFYANQAQTSGGAIENSAGASLKPLFSSNSSGDVCANLLIPKSPLFVRNGVVSGNGGAIHNAGNLRLIGGEFLGNTALQGGALFSSSDVALSFALFDGNAATSGGGVYVSGTLQLTGTDFISNSAATGAGVFVQGAATSFGTVFQRNGATVDGGGMQISGRLDDTCSRFEANHASHDAGGLLGTTGSVIVLTATRFVSNTAGNLGGGVRAGGVITANGVFYGQNKARLGGGLFADNEADLSANQFIANQAAGGAGLLHNRKDARIVNSLFARNSISTTTGTGAAMWLNVFALDAGAVSLLHNTIADTSVNPKPAIVVVSGTLGITDTIIVSHSVGISMTGGSVYEDYNLFFANPGGGVSAGVSSGAHHVFAIPQFIKPSADNYHLAPASPAIDAGIAAGVATDFDGEQRPIGAGFDIGFDEVPLRIYLPLIRR
jgi:predicted outer membrane repeat protein